MTRTTSHAAPQLDGAEVAMHTASVRDAETSQGVAHLKKALHTLAIMSTMETRGAIQSTKILGQKIMDIILQCFGHAS